MAGINESSLHREVKSRKGQRGFRAETRQVDMNGKGIIAITDIN